MLDPVISFLVYGTEAVISYVFFFKSCTEKIFCNENVSVQYYAVCMGSLGKPHVSE